MVRLLAWSSVAQAGYILAPLGACGLGARTRIGPAGHRRRRVHGLLRDAGAGRVRRGGRAARPAAADGGRLDGYRGAARRHPWVGAAFALALVGLAGLPPGLAGLFAKVAVVRSLLGGGAGWLAVVVALNAVVGLAYYVRVAAALFAPEPAAGPAIRRLPGRWRWSSRPRRRSPWWSASPRSSSFDLAAREPTPPACPRLITAGAPAPSGHRREVPGVVRGAQDAQARHAEAERHQPHATTSSGCTGRPRRPRSAAAATR